MPINFLKEIIQQEKAFPYSGCWMKKSPSEGCVGSIEGFYLFSDIQGETERWVFNDGFPGIVLFPDRNNKVYLCIYKFA